MKYLPAPLLPILVAVALALVTHTAPAYAQDIDCAKVVNARDRLACYDEQNPPDLDGTGAIYEYHRRRIVEEDITPRDSRVANPGPAPQVAATAPGQGLSDADRAMAENRRLFERAELNLTSTIAVVRRREGQKMAFQLENGQIWLQETPRPLDFRKGQTVVIKDARLGGYIMTNEGGTSTRVKRIK